MNVSSLLNFLKPQKSSNKKLRIDEKLVREIQGIKQCPVCKKNSQLYILPQYNLYGSVVAHYCECQGCKLRTKWCYSVKAAVKSWNNGDFTEFSKMVAEWKA